MHVCQLLDNHFDVSLYLPHNEDVGKYISFTLSVCPACRVCIVARLFQGLYSYVAQIQPMRE